MKKKKVKNRVPYLLNSERDFPGDFKFFLRLIAGNNETRGLVSRA
jgi:hypothetical protein